ncbi:MAG: clostripain-related cysteine peptidase, partial [Rikenellaceae bacterium]
VIKEYPTPHNAADPATLKAVIGDFKQLFPADNYGCIFWSHASAWLPKTFFNDATQKATQFSLPKPSETADIINHPLYNYIRHIEQPAQTKMFAQDGNNFMELEELEDAMKTNEFDFVIFDACYMGSIEVAYSMRNKSKWMLASPTEVLGNGIQYKTLANHLFSLSTDYTQMLKSIADDYAKKYNESTMAIYDLSKVDKFTSEYKALMANITNKVGSSTPYNVQRYDRYDDHVLFDMVDYVSTISNGRETANIQRIIDQVVVYKYSTPMFMLIPMTHYSGVSTYIPFESYIHVTPFYKGLRWYNNVLK